METIKLKKDNILRFGIVTDTGEDTGEYLQFDLEDIELPLKINQCDFEHRRNLQWLQHQFIIIDKKQDKKGKYLLSANEETKLKTLKEFYKKEMEALDLFLGKEGTKKLLNGRNPYYSMYDDISEMLEPVMPKLSQTADDIKDKIKAKYSKKKEDNVLE